MSADENKAYRVEMLFPHEAIPYITHAEERLAQASVESLNVNGYAARYRPVPLSELSPAERDRLQQPRVIASTYSPFGSIALDAMSASALLEAGKR